MEKNNSAFQRSAGVLLNVSSLPSDFSIGGFGSECARFADNLVSGNFFWWQTLPITEIGAGNSPYSGASLFAGNWLYIDPIRLAEEGLLQYGEVNAVKKPADKYAVDYAGAERDKAWLFHLAFSRIDEKIEAEVRAFEATEPWVRGYALFKAISDVLGSEWQSWERGFKFREKSALASFEKEYKKDVDYYIFVQYLFFKQWERAKAEVNARGVGIIGDMPIYPAMNSADVWANPSQFRLDGDLMPKNVAGVPPDYFCADGQLWGNPLYDFKHMKADGYAFFKARFKHMAKLYDSVRIDHFRGLDRYWAVNAKAQTAKEGKWAKGGGYNLLKAATADVPKLKIIAEDLGTLDGGVLKLLAQTGYPRMRVAQFAFADGDSLHLPHNYDTNCAAYSGTHDNDTTLGWFYKQPAETQDYVLRYLGVTGWDRSGGHGCALTSGIAKCLIKSSAKLCILPYQDIAGYGSDCRMNVPGAPSGNWVFRATYDSIFAADFDFYAKLNSLYGRARKAV